LGIIFVKKYFNLNNFITRFINAGKVILKHQSLTEQIEDYNHLWINMLSVGYRHLRSLLTKECIQIGPRFMFVAIMCLWGVTISYISGGDIVEAK